MKIPRAISLILLALVVPGTALWTEAANATDNLGDPHWHSRSMDYLIHTNFPSEARNAIHAAGDDWTNETTFDAVHQGNTSGSVDHDDWDTHIIWPGQIPAAWQTGCPPAQTLACARWTYVTEPIGGPHNVDGDVVFNTDHQPWSTDDLNCPTQQFAWDIETLALHEIGHLVTLRHTDDAVAVMFGTSTVCKRDLTQHDIDSANARYAGHQ